jgi:hypothetical protein
MAIVDGQVVTYGDLLRYRLLAGVFGFADEVPDADSEALRILIDERLIRTQVSQFPVIRITGEQVSAMVSGLDVPDGHPLLQPELIVRTARERLERTQYFDIRFRQFVTASEEEVRDYYEAVFVPEARERALVPVPPLEDVAEQIRQNVTLEETNRDIAAWIESLRRRSQIEIVE